MGNNSFKINGTFNFILDRSIYRDWELQDEKVCYEAKGRHSYGSFTLDQSGRLKGIMLEHRSGHVTCSTGDVQQRTLGLQISKYFHSNHKK